MTTDMKELFTDFLYSNGIIQFGTFTLKSGRISPYFINTGKFDTGKALSLLGRYYAATIFEKVGYGAHTIYGPAYKGIPLCVATAQAFKTPMGYSFNRKEAKTYGDKGNIVGMPITEHSRVVIVDDVITSGKAIRESMEVLKTYGSPQVMGIVISIDRQERGLTDKSSIQEISEEFKVPVYSIVTITEVVDRLFSRNLITPKKKEDIENYLKIYSPKA